METYLVLGGENLADLILDPVGMLSSESDILIPVINFVKNWELIFILVVWSYNQITPALEFSLPAVKVNEVLFGGGMFYKSINGVFSVGVVCALHPREGGISAV